MSIKPFDTNSIRYKGFLRELAYHEASHFVFDCLLAINVPDFEKIKYVIVCPKNVKLDGWNLVHGCNPKGYSREETETYHIMAKFYREDKKRGLGRIFSRLAGYYSFKKFVKATDYFFSIDIHHQNKLEYHNLHTAYYYYHVNDLQNVRACLGYYGIVEDVEKYGIINSLYSGVDSLMSIPAVTNSIKYVKNHLIRCECKKIEGEDVKNLEKEVYRLTNKVPYIEILNFYLHLIEVE